MFASEIFFFFFLGGGGLIFGRAYFLFIDFYLFYFIINFFFWGGGGVIGILRITVLLTDHCRSLVSYRKPTRASQWIQHPVVQNPD